MGTVIIFAGWLFTCVLIDRIVETKKLNEQARIRRIKREARRQRQLAERETEEFFLKKSA